MTDHLLNVGLIVRSECGNANNIVDYYVIDAIDKTFDNLFTY